MACVCGPRVRQATESFAKLVPQGLRRQHFMKWIKNKTKSGSMAVRFLRSGASKKEYAVEVRSGKALLRLCHPLC